MSYEQYKTPSAGGSSLQNNYVATAAPTVNDDSSAGYSVGSVWIDVSADERYVCLDATDTAAVWEKSTTGTASEIVNTPAGNIASTSVQAALNELDSEKQASGNYFVKGTDTADDVPDGTTNKAYTATEKTKLAGVETGADVTDATNVDAAGATMNSDTNVSGNSWVLDEDTMSSNSATKVPTQQSVKAYIDSGSKTMTNTRITPRVTSEASSATPTINTDNTDLHSITALATAITSFTTNLSGTPTNGQKLVIRIKDNGTGRAITWGASFEAKGVDLPTTTTASKVLTVGFLYDTVTSKWGCVASVEEA